MKKIDHLPVNWVNGQKISSSHFFETYYNVVEMQKLNREDTLTSYNYGLGQSMEGADHSVVLDVRGETAKTLTVRLISCNAVTRNGFHISYTKDLYGDFVPEATLQNMDIDLSTRQVVCVMLTVNPYKMLPVGVPDPEGNSLIVSKIVVDNGTFAVDEDYIPAIQQTNFFDKASEFLTYFEKTLEETHNNALKVYSKNITNPHRSVLADNTFALCDVIKAFYGRHIFELKYILGEKAPIHVVHLANELATLLLSTLRSLPEKDFETLLQYFDEWTNIRPSEFMNNASKVAHISYNHGEISQSFSLIYAFLKVIHTLFQKLSDLEYVGLIKENIIISEEHNGKASENERKSWKVWD